MNEIMKEFPVVCSQDLIWRDMDAYQHINNAVYLRYFEDARMAYFKKTNLLEHKEETQIGPILASTTCNFRAPLTYPDTIHIGATVEKVRLKSFKMKYVIYSESIDRVAADGEGLIVFYDYQQERSCEIPQFILTAIQNLQSGVN